MEITELKDKDAWNSWIIENGDNPTYLQSYQWGEILELTGQRIKRYVMKNDEKIVAQAQIAFRGFVFGWPFAMCHKGPIFNPESSDEEIKQVYKLLVDECRKEKNVTLRVEPKEMDHKLIGARKTIEINPSTTLIVGVENNEDELLAQMSQKTRYNINLAKRKELVVKIEKNFNVFWDLMQKTSVRDRFGLHGKAHYEKVMASENIHQITVYDGETAICTAGLIGFGKTLTYLYGASDHKYRQLMGPYLMQWDAIRLAKKLGYKYYDFFGIAPQIDDVDEYRYDEKHIYAGITRFKLGFSGVVHQASSTYDLVIDRFRYGIYLLIKKLKLR